LPSGYFARRAIACPGERQAAFENGRPPGIENGDGGLGYKAGLGGEDIVDAISIWREGFRQKHFMLAYKLNRIGDAGILQMAKWYSKCLIYKALKRVFALIGINPS
jgi:hypothetical protein